MIDLTNLNTLHVAASAKDLLEINTITDLKRLDTTQPFMFLGSGANILFTKDFPGVIAKINLAGKKVVQETDNDILIEVAAGENWHKLVTWTVDNDWSGLENMALIPSTVGAAAVGNIAAYGQNQEDVIDSVMAIDLSTGKTEKFSQVECKFAYRESFFKHQNKYLVTSVFYRLSKKFDPQDTYHDRYISLQGELTKIANSPYSIRDVYQAVINIRSDKLPNWNKVGTAGSFFKNPLISKEKYLKIASQVPQLQWYSAQKLQYKNTEELPEIVKIPAGRLLDYLGWKGKTVGRVSTSPNQALYVINLGGATGQEIYEYSEAMRADIKKNFDVDVEYEVIVL